MGRLIVLCLIFLSAFFSPGNVCAISITGEVWSTTATNVLNSATTPSKGPPSTTPDATFVVTNINFDSRLYGNPQGLTYNQFLNITDPKQWTMIGANFDPAKSMFSKVPADPVDQGIFFRFTMSLDIPAGPLPITITHDDGFYFSILNIYEFGPKTSDPVTGPVPSVTRFDVKGFDPGTYPATINYGVLNDSANHVLIYNTPEPWTILLLGLGMIGLGILRRKI